MAPVVAVDDEAFTDHADIGGIDHLDTPAATASATKAKREAKDERHAL